MDTLVMLKPNNLYIICECWYLEPCCGIIITPLLPGWERHQS